VDEDAGFFGLRESVLDEEVGGVEVWKEGLVIVVVDGDDVVGVGGEDIVIEGENGEDEFDVGTFEEDVILNDATDSTEP